MNIDTRARRAAQGLHRAVEAMEMSMQTQTPQKIERLDAYRARQNRVRRIGAFAVAAAVLVGAVVIGMRALEREFSRQTGSRTTKISQAEAERILYRVVIPFDEPPQGMTFLLAKTGISALGDLFEDLVAPGWARVGFVDGRLNAYRTPGTDRFLSSHALVYEDPGAAASVFARLEGIVTAAPPRGYGFPRPEPLGIGEKGWRYEVRSDTPKDCRHLLFYLWRSGPVIMIINSCHPDPLSNDELADRMQAGSASRDIA